MYKIITKTDVLGTNTTIMREGLNDNTFFSIGVDNADYQRFKKEINEETAQLKDADGNVMTAQQAKQFIATLP
jgi:hypothetical protein